MIVKVGVDEAINFCVCTVERAHRGQPVAGLGPRQRLVASVEEDPLNGLGEITFKVTR